MIENYDEKLKKHIDVMRFMPPNVLADSVIEADEATRGVDNPQEEYELIIDAAFEIERTNNGYADFVRQIIDRAFENGRAIHAAAVIKAA